MTKPSFDAGPALVLAPLGRDASVAAKLLSGVGLEPIVCRDLAQFSMLLSEDILCAVVTEEALGDADLTALSRWVSTQPSWSDFPFVILTQRGGGSDRNPDAARLSQTLGNVTFLERPFHPMTFVSVIGTAKRGRYRQYEARSRMGDLNESEARLRTALTAGQLGEWELDLSPFVLSASAGTKAVFGRSPSRSFSYADLQACLPEEDGNILRNAVRLSMETGDDLSVECRTVWPDGTLHWAELRARLVPDLHRQSARLVGVSSNITVRKMAEENLRQVNETLEAKVVERTAQLKRAHEAVLEEISQREHAEDVLRRVQKMEMIGQLTGGVAHDFNNLLMAVLSNLELLRKQVSGEKLQNLVGGAIRGAQRGASLTQRLLAFARQQDLEIEPTQLSDLIHGVSDLLARSVGPLVELVFDLPEKLPLTLVDTNQVELAVLNLVVNARDAMPDGGTITIRVDDVQTTGREELAAGDYVRLTVSDTGSGMDAETLSKATEPFFTTKEVGKGTGLGLSMIHGLALQLNGALHMRSAPGLGTDAELWLPVTTRQPAASVVAPDSPQVTQRVPARATILLVDDDALILSSTAYLLEDLGHQVIEANSAMSALDILQRGQKVDLLITDYSMPKMTGSQLASAVRKLKPDLPIVIATGYAELPSDADSDIPRLRKPYRQDELLAEIQKALTRESASGHLIPS